MQKQKRTILIHLTTFLLPKYVPVRECREPVSRRRLGHSCFLPLARCERRRLMSFFLLLRLSAPSSVVVSSLVPRPFVRVARVDSSILVMVVVVALPLTGISVVVPIGLVAQARVAALFLLEQTEARSSSAATRGLVYFGI